MKKLAPWLGSVLILVIIFGTIYGVVQQAQRLGANMPQIQMAEDTAALLNKETRPQVLTQGDVNIQSSLAPFLIVYSKSGKLVSGSGFLNGKVPTAPIGVLTNSNNKDYSTVTWQPSSDVRIAAVTVAANNYYVLSGRNLKEVEKNENHTFWLAFAGGVFSLAVLALAYVVAKPSRK